MAQGQTAQTWAVGGVIFGAILMVMLGIWQVVLGVAMIADDSLFVLRAGYVYELNTTAWGWIHVVLGALVVVAGIALASGAMWARMVGGVLAALVAIGNFIFLPYHPVFAVVAIALAVFVLWAVVAVDRRSLTGPTQ